jgi:hypothetical protein
MSDFDRRWQDCVSLARQAASGPVEAPAGFATRAWSRWTAPSSPCPNADWTALSLRALILATIALLICAMTEFHSASAGSAFALHLEDVVTRVWGQL